MSVRVEERVPRVYEGDLRVAAAYAEYGINLARPAGDFVYASGLVAYGETGAIYAPGDGERQRKEIYKVLVQVLSAYAATLSDVVKESGYTTDWSAVFGCDGRRGCIACGRGSRGGDGLRVIHKKR
jgi:hypothetical protein